MMVWATKKSIIGEIAEVPENWLSAFAAHHPEHIRKFGDAKNSKLLFNVPGVLSAVENGETFREALAAKLKEGGEQ